MPTTNVKISIRDVELWSRKQARGLGTLIREDTIVDAMRGIGPDGGQYPPYETPGEEGRAVDLTQNGTMLEGIKLRVRKTTLTLVPGAFYGKFQQSGTIDPDELTQRKADIRASRPFRKYDFNKRRKGRALKSADKGNRKPGGSIPARPFMVLRPRTLKKMERWIGLTLERAFRAKSLREVISTAGGGF